MPRHCTTLDPNTEYGSDGYDHALKDLHYLRKKKLARLFPGTNLDLRCHMTVFIRANLDRDALANTWPKLLYVSPYEDPPLNNTQDQTDPETDNVKGDVRIDQALALKARTDNAYKEFINAVTSACASPAAVSLKIVDCHFVEKQDLEDPSWLKLILRVDFAGGDFHSKRARRITLRQILDERIGAAEQRSDTRERVSEMAGRFFITVSW